MPEPSAISALRASRDAALADAMAAEERVRALDAAIAQAEREGRRDDVTRLRGERVATNRRAIATRADYSRLRDQAFAALASSLNRSPESVVNKLTDQCPFVLLPVRIETSFAPSPTGPTLRVRFYPDDISLAPPLAPVSTDEGKLGRAYWRKRAASRHAPRSRRARRGYETAWATLAARAGAYRAGWVVRATRPVNPDAAPSDLQFTDPAPPTDPAVSRAALLPDRFVVIGFVADPTTHALRSVVKGVGAPIPDDLVIAPDPSQAETFLTRDDGTGRLIVPDALKWMVDYDAAVRVGMAMTIWLAPPFDTQGFDRLVAVGVRAATAPEDAPAAMQTLLEKHRYGHGCAILPSGTPTNNTDIPSGWQPPSSESAALFTLEDSPPDLGPGKGLLGISDGWRVGHLFGLNREFVRRLPNAARTDVAEALAMNRAAVAGTLDDFIDVFLKGVVTPQRAIDLHNFFTAWVSGRGVFPTLGVGRQPYGIVVTGAWGNWKFPPNTALDGAQGIYDLIAAHRIRWQELGRRAPHASQAGGDPFQRLLSIIGLLASSSEFVTRRAVSEAYVRERASFGGADAAAIQGWVNQLRALRDQSLSGVILPETAGLTDPLLAFIVFTQETTEWRLPIIDRDPAVPLSETDPILPYDGSHNYLSWLTQASRDDLAAQRFVDATGAAVAAPTALLYVMLRHAVLAALEAGALAAAQQHGSPLFGVIDRDPLIANIGDVQHVQRRDYLTIDASRLGLASTPTALSDWTLGASRQPTGAPEPVARLAEVQQAIAALSNLPTARLERLFTEHLDLCSYRLDAWITAIYAQRLSVVQAAQQKRAFHIGTFGWVENLRPTANRMAVPADALPQVLRDGAGPRLFRDFTSGGYLHAPSLAQAASAAVLRNGHISHAGSAPSRAFAVDLSSARMRTAMALADGVRAGQSMAALLGYQFERGLHEGHPGLELDQFIGLFRDRFPLLSGRLTEVTQGTNADLVEARNVVDGLALVEATSGQFYPYGMTGLPGPFTSEAVAIQTEIWHLSDALDAVADLLTSESVHQAVHGNLARTQGAQQAMTSPTPPPEPEIIRTPRTGRVLTFRVALAFNAASVSGWTPALTPRARANPQLNHWLAQHLPEPRDIQWNANVGGTDKRQSLVGDGLEPIDVVLMSGERIGDRSSELERYLIRRYRWTHQLTDDQETAFDFSAAAPGKTSLASLQPLLARLRRLITRSRAAHAGDWRRSADVAQATPGDPTGSASGMPALEHFKDLTDRVEQSRSDLQAARKALAAALSAIGTLRAALEADPARINDPAWRDRLEELRGRLFDLVPFGVPEAVPVDGLAVTGVLVDRLLQQAAIVLKIADERLQRASDLLATTFTDPLPTSDAARAIEAARRNDLLRQARTDAAAALLGPSFVMLPLFRLPSAQAAEIAQSLAAAPADADALEDWLSSVSRVRPRIADLVWSLTAARWLRRPIAGPVVVQLPFRAGAPWIGATFGDALDSGEWLSVAVFGNRALGRPLFTALLIDDWTETVPADRETTGVAFNFNRPNAVAAQAVLVAVPPEQRGHWIWDDLVGAINEALDLAKIRAVEPDALIGRRPDDPVAAGAYFQVLPALLSEFTSGRLAVADFASIVAGALASP